MQIDDEALIKAWLAGKRRGTRRVYGQVVDEFRRRVRKPLAEVTLSDAKTWWTQWQKQKAATRARKLKTLQSLYRYGQAHAEWPHNPFLSIETPKVKDHLALRMPTPDEVWTLMAAATRAGPRTAALVALVFGTGCRISEVVDATWSTIIPGKDRWLWHVPHRRADAVLPLRPELITALQQWRAAQGADPQYWPADDVTPLFPNAEGGLSHPVTLTASIRRLAVKSGLKPIPAFGLRHAHAGLALEHGASLGLVQRSLGHHRRASTERYLSVVQPPNASADFLPWREPPS